MLIESHGISEKLTSYITLSKKSLTAISKEAGLCQAVLRHVCNALPISEESASKIIKYLASKEPKQKPKKINLPNTFKRYPNGFVFVYPDDLNRLDEEERSSVKSAKLTRGKQYYCQGRTFILMGEPHIFKDGKKK